MAASEHTRPRTRSTDQPRRGEIVWDDALGWGIVVEAGDEGRLVWTPRGADGAWRRFRACLLTLQRKYGRDSRPFWEAQKREGRKLVTQKTDGPAAH